MLLSTPSANPPERSERELDRVRRIYDRDPVAYDRGMRLSERWLRLRRREVGEAASGHVLEVAIGTGLSLPWYPVDGRIASLTGVELSAAMLEVARARLPELELPFPVTLIEGDAQTLAGVPVPEGGFDTVVFSLCLCTIPDPAAALAAAVRGARPGARMLFLEHVRSPIWPVAVVQALIDPILVWLQGDHFTRRTESTIRAAGITVDRLERWFLGVFVFIDGHA